MATMQERKARNHEASCQRQHIEQQALYRELEKPLGRIVDFVCSTHLVSREEVLRKGREQHIVAARHVAIYLCRALTPASYPMIGQFFGRNHTSMIHACLAVEARIAREPEFARRIANAKRDLAVGRDAKAVAA